MLKQLSESVFVLTVTSSKKILYLICLMIYTLLFNIPLAMKNNLPFFILILLPFCISCSSQPMAGKEVKDNTSIEILDEEALTLIDPEAELEVIGSGFDWTEGPLWLEEEQLLLFSDIPPNIVYQIGEDGEAKVYLKPSGYTGTSSRGGEVGSNGLIRDPEGALVLFQHGDRRVAKMQAPTGNPAPDYITLVDRFESNRLNSPNDGVYDKAGNLYFTDPPYGLEGNMDDPAKELDFQGIFCLKTDGELVLVDSISRPNGIALNPGETRLLVANSDRKHAVWYQYDLLAPGEVSNKQLFFDSSDLIGKEGQKGLPDGMKMHSSGYLFASGPGGIWIFNPAGKPIARIHTGEATSNCAFSADEKTLFMTADDYVLRMGLR